MIKSKNILTTCRVVLFCLGCAIILAITSGATKSFLSSYSNSLSIGLALLCTFLLSVAFARWEALTLKEIWIIPGSKTVRRLLTGLCLGALLAALQPLLVLAMGHISLSRSPESSFASIFPSLMLYILIACREEIAFRGYPMSTLNRSMGAVYAQSIIAVIFIIEHKIGGMDWIEAIIGPGMGAIFFGMAALKTKGLALSTGLHAAWNFTQWFLGFKTQPGIYHASIEKGFEEYTKWTGWGSYILVMALGICIVRWSFSTTRD